MTIRRITLHRIALPFEIHGSRTVIRPEAQAWKSMECLLVRVDTDDGLTGWGEAFGHFVNAGTQAVLRTLVGPWFIGQAVADIASTMARAHRAFYGYGRSGPVMYALSAIEIALWDIESQRAGKPLYRHLGGSTGTLEGYASLMRYGGDPAAVAANVERARQAGYRLIKLHENTLPAIEAARAAMDGAGEVALDVNVAWSPDEALSMIDALDSNGYAWLEEPIWPCEDFERLATLRTGKIAIAGGENIGTPLEFRRALQAGAFDVIQPSITKIGGFHVMREVAALARGFSVRLVPHCFYWGPGYLATAHFLASLPEAVPLETAFIDFERPPHDLFHPGQATLTLGERPGLGFEADWDYLGHYTLATERIGG
ncbi:mandelate racemase/muconate lactonizing enzyme family protein [uncultured Pigmentiphaga sp.]|uniref:mandelate racemase/muconate lactonizing enzyme family protein n=1 Tax=uncultured Pigmentiphaga sp. TaxID=340361 RepID=UPI0026345E45|nr:mandelate racemase/muconate lactonizing enzyme family protein [uncultured Pigmentiphaga sp.]